MHSPTNILISLSLAFILFAATTSHAEETREACRGDAIKLCPDEVTNRDHAAIRRCIRKHYSELSDRCQAAIQAKKEKAKDLPNGA